MKYRTNADRVFHIVNLSLVSILFAIILFPLIFIISASISDPLAVIQGKVYLWPVGFTLEGYQEVLLDERIVLGYINSFLYMTVGSLVSVIMIIATAYPLSRADFPDRNFIMGLFIFTMLFYGGIIPTYLTIKGLGLLDTRTAVILPGALSVYNMIVARTFFQNSLPAELLEAAQIEGCGDFRFIIRIVIPLSGPIIAVITLFCAVFYWNQFFDPLLYLNSSDKFPLQLILRDVLLASQQMTQKTDMDPETMLHLQRLAELLKYSLIVIASLPLMLLYPFLQRYFVKGVMIGSIKG